MKALRAFILSSCMLKTVFYRFSGLMASYCFVGCLLFLMAQGTAIGQNCTPPNGGIPETPMVYHCGPILSTPQTTHVIVINPNGSSISDRYKIYLETYLQDIGDTPYLGMVMEYGGSSHSSYAGEWSSTLAGPPGLHYIDWPIPPGGVNLSPNNVSFYLEEALRNNPSWKTGPSDEYFVLLPPNATVLRQDGGCVGPASCSSTSPNIACGYHGPFFSPSRAATIYYAVIGYGCGFNFTNWPGPDLSTSQSLITLAHEQLEMITDPELNGWGEPSSGLEVMDKCVPDTDWQQRADGTNVRLKYFSYLLPKMWSNLRHSCLRPGPFGQVKNATTQEIGINTNGTLELFGLGGDGQVWHDYQGPFPGGWSGWGSLNAPWSWSIHPVVGTNADGRLELFQVGPDQQMWHLWQNAPSSGPWNGGTLGGQFQSMIPAVAANADGRLEVFALGTDGQVWHNDQVVPNGGWSGWSSFTAPWSWNVAPSVGINGDGRLEIFMVGPDKAMWHLWQAAPSSGPWYGGSMGGQFQSMSPAVAANADGRLEAFAVGTDGQLWHSYQGSFPGGWSEWSSLSAPWSWTVPPRVVINRDKGLEIFMVGPDRAIWHLWQNAPNADTSWGGASLGGAFMPMAPAIGTNTDGNLEVFGIGADSGMWHNWQGSCPWGWCGWYMLGGVFSQM